MSVEELTNHRGGGSGGYLEHVFRHAAQELFGIHVAEVTYTPVRSVAWVGRLDRAIMWLPKSAQSSCILLLRWA